MLICYACSQETKLLRIFGHWTKSLIVSYPIEKYPRLLRKSQINYTLPYLHFTDAAHFISFFSMVHNMTLSTCMLNWYSVSSHIWLTRNTGNVIFVTLPTYIDISMYHDQTSCLSSFKLRWILCMTVLFESL